MRYPAQLPPHGMYLRAARLRAHMTLQEVSAALAEHGLRHAATTIAQWETIRLPRADVWVALCQVLCVDPCPSFWRLSA